MRCPYSGVETHARVVSCLESCRSLGDVHIEVLYCNDKIFVTVCLFFISSGEFSFVQMPVVETLTIPTGDDTYSDEIQTIEDFRFGNSSVRSIYVRLTAMDMSLLFIM